MEDRLAVMKVSNYTPAAKQRLEKVREIMMFKQVPVNNNQLAVVHAIFTQVTYGGPQQQIMQVPLGQGKSHIIAALIAMFTQHRGKC